jgi:hypothetical protein
MRSKLEDLEAERMGALSGRLSVDHLAGFDSRLSGILVAPAAVLVGAAGAAGQSAWFRRPRPDAILAAAREGE